MSDLNNVLNSYLGKTFESMLQIVKSTFNGFYDVIKNNNSLIMILILLIIIVILAWDKKNKKRSSIFTKIKLINLISHIGLACIFGHLFRIINIEKINQLLSFYWTIGYVLFCFIIFLLIKEISIYIKSINKITKNFTKIYYFLGLTYIFTAISINQLGTVNDFLLILIFILGWSLLQLLSRETLYKSDKVDEQSDIDIQSYKQLMPTRQKELKNILTLLMRNNYNEPFALLLNGNWGEGKTSLINVLTKKLNRDGNFNIFIQPLILDTTEKQMKYFFSQLEDILKSNGIYTGKDSPFKKYINIVFQSINTLNLKQVIKLDGFLDKLDDNEQEDFRRTKEILENDIQRLLKNVKPQKSIVDDQDLSELSNYKVIHNKIFIIVDDFDRVEEETFKNTLIFIKELVNFKGVNVIFLMDEQLIDKYENINREYLDKFVNKKFQLSKLHYQEIFNYFIKNLDVEKLNGEWSIEVGNKIKKNIVEIVSNIILDFEKRVEEIQKNIDSLSKNKSTKNQKEDQEKQSIINLEKNLSKEKEEFQQVLYKLKDGLSNSRKAKKIIRELQEILNFCSNEVNSRNQNFINNLNSIDQVDDLILRISIYKVLFGIHLDNIRKQNDDFYSVMTKIKYLQLKDYLLKSLFMKYINSSNTEEQGLKMDITNDFCNALIFNGSIDDLLKDKKTVSQEILEKLDDPNMELDIDSLEGIKEYQKTILFNSYNIASITLYLRRKKLIDKIISLYEQGLLNLRNLFELLSEPQRNPFLEDELYLSTLNTVISESENFQDLNDKKISQNYLEGISLRFFLSYKKYIIMLMRLLKLRDTRYSYESIAEDMGNILQFEQMVDAIKRINNLEDTSESPLGFFKQWFNNSIQEIESEYSNNEYIINATKFYAMYIQKFVNMYEMKNEIEEKLKSSKVNPINKFKEKLVYTSIEELVNDIEDIYSIAFDKNHSITNEYLRYFSTILGDFERYTRNNKVENSIINKIIEIYDVLPVDNYEEDSDEKSTWIFCTLKIGEIIENTERLNKS